MESSRNYFFFLSRNVLEVITDFLLIAWLIDLMYIWVKQIIKKYRIHRVGICLYPPIVDWMESYINHACNQLRERGGV